MTNHLLSISSHIAVIDGQPTTTTQDIAEVYGKRHDDVLRVVRQRMLEAGEWGLRNFTDTPYTNPQNGQTYPVIRMTKKGFHFIIGKFTGAKAVAHQIAFADAFEMMEAALAGATSNANAQLTITPAQAGELATLIAERFPEGEDRPYAWGRFNRHFRIARYRELPASRFHEACAYIRAMPSRALPVPVQPLALPRNMSTTTVTLDPTDLYQLGAFLRISVPRAAVFGCVKILMNRLAGDEVALEAFRGPYDARIKGVL